MKRRRRLRDATEKEMRPCSLEKDERERILFIFCLAGAPSLRVVMDDGAARYIKIKRRRRRRRDPALLRFIKNTRGQRKFEWIDWCATIESSSSPLSFPSLLFWQQRKRGKLLARVKCYLLFVDLESCATVCVCDDFLWLWHTQVVTTNLCVSVCIGTKWFTLLTLETAKPLDTDPSFHLCLILYTEYVLTYVYNKKKNQFLVAAAAAAVYAFLQCMHVLCVCLVVVVHLLSMRRVVVIEIGPRFKPSPLRSSLSLSTVRCIILLKKKARRHIIDPRPKQQLKKSHTFFPIGIYCYFASFKL